MTTRKPYIRLCCALAMSAVFSARAAQVRVETEAFNDRDEKVGALKAGANVEVLEGGGEWIKVRFIGGMAWFECYVKAADVDTSVAIPAGLMTVNPVPAAPMLGEPGTNTLATTNAPAPPTNAPVAKLTSTRAGPSLALSTHWQMQPKIGTIAAGDLRTLLKPVTTGVVNLVASENYVLYGDLYYMMPLADALKRYGQTIVQPENVATPGFPADSFKAYSFDPKTNGISRLTLIVDLKNQLVGVQATDSGIKNFWLARRFVDHESVILYSRDLKLFDIALTRSKGTANWRVGAIMEAVDGVVHIDTELLDGDPKEDSTLTPVRSRERIRLRLAKPVADLCRHLLDARK